MSRCQRCGGTMLAGECLMCQHDNAEPVPVIRPYHGDGGRAYRGTYTKRSTEDIDADYQRFLAALEGREGPFVARDIATEIDASPYSIGSWLRRAQSDGIVRKLGPTRVHDDGDVRRGGQVTEWEAVGTRQEHVS